MLAEWEISHQVTSCCFDTTNVNSGHQHVALVLLQALNKHLLWLACRHNVDVILTLVFEKFQQSVCMVYCTQYYNIQIVKSHPPHTMCWKAVILIYTFCFALFHYHAH